ncbi:MAG: hypothetical protein M1820_006617 [Bogoriella megaspora]|nr:MAG: hypothetical protein M1820_006617 [Bogoriella megaspora]
METPSAKRRKTTHDQPNEDNGLRSTPRRASFMSPTKASLARFNPNLLSDLPTNANVASRPASRGGNTSKGAGLRNYVLGEKATAKEDSRPLQEPASDPFVTTNEENNDRRRGAKLTAQHGNTNSTVAPEKRAPLRVSSRTNILPPPVEDEADLPATPQGLEELEYDPPPRGILFSSPSKRGRRTKTLQEKLKSSPLKPVQLDQSLPAQDDSVVASPSRQPENVAPESQDLVPSIPALESPPPATRPNQPSQGLRRKLQEREKLQEEYNDLFKEIEKFESTIKALDADEDVPIQDLMCATIPPPRITSTNRPPSDLIDEPSPVDTDPSTAPLPLSQALLSFTTFSSLLPTPRPPSTSETPTSPIPSHHPIKLSDPLPHLQVFTPFTYTSTISTPLSPQSTTNNNNQSQPSLTQTHHINVYGPSSLFYAEIDMDIDTAEQRISRFSVDALSAWAEPELGEWIRSAGKKGGPTENDVGSVGWAMGRYWEMAVKRARCWGKCERAWPGLVVGGREDGGEAGDAREDGVGGEVDVDVLKRYLGRRRLVLKSEEVEMEVGWGIGFDWTGEAESEVDVWVHYNPWWSETDDRGSLKKIPETFRSLVKSRGVFGAVKVMVGLLFENA